MEYVNSDIAYKYIREKILSSELAPGAPLSTKSLAGDIGVSRTPVRDALRQLESDGLVEIRPRMGAVVRSMTLKEFKEVCVLRQVLEVYCTGIAAKYRTDTELEEIQTSLNKIRKLNKRVISKDAQESDVLKLADEDARFHLAIISAAKNELIREEILRLQLLNGVLVEKGSHAEFWGMLSPLEAKNLRMEIQNEHEVIFSAIQQKRVTKAKKAMEEHLQNMMRHDIQHFGDVEQAKFRALL